MVATHFEAYLEPAARYLTLDDVRHDDQGQPIAEWCGYRSRGKRNFSQLTF